MRARLRPVGMLAGGALVLALAVPQAYAQSDEYPAEQLRCASGFGCTDLVISAEEMRVLLGIEGQNAARDLYATRHPEAYIEDAFSSPRQDADPSAPTNRPETSAGTELFDGTEVPARPIELFEGTEEPTRPIDLFADTPGTASTDATAPDTRDYTALEGYAEVPCPGELYDAPDFMHMPGHKVGICLTQTDALNSDCGLPAARAFCLKQQRSKVGCFGVKTSERAVNVGLYCQGGNCLSFSFIVCR